MSWSWLAGKLSRCEEGMARVFAVRAQVIWDIRVSWVVKYLEGCEVVMVFQNCLGSKAQCRGRTCLGARICHGCRIFIASSARIQVQLSFLSCLGSRNLFAKTVTSNLPLLSVLGVRVVKMSRYWGLVGYRKFSGFQYSFSHPGRITYYAW